MNCEFNFSFDIDIKKKKVYFTEESGAGAEYEYKNIDDIGEITKFYLNNYYREYFEKYGKLLKNKETVDYIYGFLKEQNETKWIDLEKLKILQDEEYVLPGDSPKDLQKKLDKLLENLWDGLEDIPFYEKDGEQYIEEDYLEFEEGTSREDIWHWFDERHSKGVPFLLYEYENKNYTEEEEEEI